MHSEGYSTFLRNAFTLDQKKLISDIGHDKKEISGTANVVYPKFLAGYV
jgi:hypothetical protein